MTSLEVYIEKEKIPDKEIKNLFKSMQNKKTLQANGGFLLKMSLNSDKVLLGVMPVLTEGARNKHYDIYLPKIAGSHFSGFYNADETLGIIPLIGQGEDHRDEEKLRLFLMGIIQFSATLIEYKWPSDLKLDWSSKQVLKELGAEEPIAQTLGELKSLKTT